jgi:hypothetical protein
MPKGQYRRKSPQERFFAFIEKDFCDPVCKRCNSEEKCWKWNGCLDSDGYANFSMIIDGKYKTVRGTKAAWFFAKGVWPTYQMNHLCGNRFCCNPSHLYDGTHPDNVNDAKQDGSYKATGGTFKPGQMLGEKNNNASLTEEEVIEIKRDILRATQYGALKKVAEKWNIQYQNVQKIKNNKMWASVPWPDD